jgi:hypothetical protein
MESGVQRKRRSPSDERFQTAQQISVISSYPVTRHELRYVFRLSHTHGFLVEPVSSDGALASLRKGSS